ncbi:MAG: sigma-54 dependent transcriptional regulator [Rhodothermales bacterium]|jgi:DNA-binding NtrC family response regulator
MDREAIQERFGIIGPSDAIRHIIDRVRLVSGTDITVLLSGESGVGKELFANAIHSLSPRSRDPLVVVNCGAIPEGLLESELFGAEKGAYTGSIERRTGYFEQADKGTIFLDEIGEMPLAAQVRLLRVLETGEFSRVGASTTKRVDVRIMAATNKNLAREVHSGRFREDLYYRLSTVLIDIPPLRDRSEDILPIFENVIEQFARKYDAPFKRLEPEAKELLTKYRWPGNVRELRNVAEQVVVLTRGSTISSSQLRPFLRGVTAGSSTGLILATEAGRDDEREVRERELIYRLLLELRVEITDLKEMIKSGVAHKAPAPERSERPVVPTPDPDRALPPHRGDLQDLEESMDLIEEALYEIQTDDTGAYNGRSSERELPTMEEAEKALITEALRRFEGNRRQTAKVLGISERTLYRKLKSLDIDI